jgi:hypothetical protein
LLKVNNDPNVKQWVKFEFLELYKEKNNLNRNVILAILCQNFLESVEVKNIVQNILNVDVPIDDFRVSLIALASSGDSWLKANFLKVVRGRTPYYLIEALQVLHILCPKNQLEIFKWFFKNQYRKLIILDILKEIEILKDTKLLVLLERQRKNKFWDSSELEEIDISISELKSVKDINQSICYIKDQK